MTCIVAARFGDETVIGADSLTTIGDRKLIKNVNDSKLVSFGQFIVGLSGMGPVRECLCDLLDGSDELDSWANSSIDNRSDVSRFLAQFMSLFSERGDAEDIESVQLLIATPKQIFFTNGEASIFEVQEFWAIGAGADYALGALECLYEASKSDPTWLVNVVGHALEVACKYSASCQPPIEVEVLRESASKT